jgi:tetratricopeptide (TPR) repeat protein
MRRFSLAGLVCTLLAGSVQAGEPPPEARVAYDAGVEHFRAGRYADAIAEFNKAYRVAPNPVLVFNMARAFEELKDFGSATTFYKRYLEMAPEAPDRRVVEESIRTLELLAARQEKPAQGLLIVRSKPDGASVLINGRPAGSTPLKVELGVGKHFVAIEQVGFTRDIRELNIDKDQQLEHDVVLVPLAMASEDTGEGIAAWILLGVGTTLVLGGGVVGVLALERDQQLDDIESGKKLSTASKYGDIQDEGRTYAYLADGLMVGGLAAAITGGVLLLLGDDPPAPAQAAHPGALRVEF